ncbi:MAG: LysR family transcriptional regulator, partial [Pseudomonadales bacterium]|nr:LysR family transcriptional regulator [Pseudomonadales bacterium]
SICVPSTVIIDDGPIAMSLVEQGVGLVYASVPTVAALVEAGKVRCVLEDWCSPGPAFHIYYPSRRQVPVGLRVLIDLIREIRPLGL